DEYFIVVGANNRSDGGELNIATQEKKGLIRKAFSQPPSRNEALLWLVKTYAEDSLFAEANSLVQLLRKDRLFPRRLHPQLDEVLAYTFYRQEQWDSAAFYLERALVNAPNKTELARWEYLLAQLHALRNRPETASAWFNKAKTHTTDPVLYIHARIYEAQLVKRTDRDPLQDALADLLKLTRKERFDGYEDVLYYAAAGIALKKQDTMQARRLLLQSTRYNTENPPLRNKAYLQMATLAYRQRDYAFAAGCYDSLDLQDPWVMQAGEELERRKEVLRELVQQIRVVQREDSLQRIAQLPEKELETYLRNLVKQLRKQRGLKEEESSYFNPAVVTGGQATDQPLFQTAGSGGAWYFNITAQRSKGFSEFKGRWGNRPNIDNWRRQSAIDVFAGAPGAMPGNPGGDVDRPGGAAAGADDDEEGDLTVESLREKLPFSDEQVRESNLKIVEALFRQGQIYKNQLEDYAEAARTFEEIWKRFQGFEQEEATLFELYYCYQKAGEPEKSARFRKLLQQKFPEGNYEQKITQATSPASPEADAKTRTYQTIYNLFIEGRFTEALQQKARADSIYGTSYWTPQLLYIESLYHIRQRNDSTALETLTRIEANFPGTPMAGKAAIVKDVLNRRAEIEDYLTRTPIVRQQEDAI
ncbi:MAG TPA: tetratricopeptide repeat protein, partial [Lacibacter sp.]|nr:tetratricopeptide repeat protein [Lacibacter sp.]